MAWRYEILAWQCPHAVGEGLHGWSHACGVAEAMLCGRACRSRRRVTASSRSRLPVTTSGRSQQPMRCRWTPLQSVTMYRGRPIAVWPRGAVEAARHLPRSVAAALHPPLYYRAHDLTLKRARGSLKSVSAGLPCQARCAWWCAPVSSCLRCQLPRRGCAAHHFLDSKVWLGRWAPSIAMATMPPSSVFSLLCHTVAEVTEKNANSGRNIPLMLLCRVLLSQRNLAFSHMLADILALETYITSTNQPLRVLPATKALVAALQVPTSRLDVAERVTVRQLGAFLCLVHTVRVCSSRACLRWGIDELQLTYDIACECQVSDSALCLLFLFLHCGMTVNTGDEIDLEPACRPQRAAGQADEQPGEEEAVLGCTQFETAFGLCLRQPLSGHLTSPESVGGGGACSCRDGLGAQKLERDAAGGLHPRAHACHGHDGRPDASGQGAMSVGEHACYGRHF